MVISAPSIALTVAFTLIASYLLYQRLLPRPLPGIPYNKASAHRLLGDVPDALAYHAETQEVMSFLTKRCTELNSPIIQVFMRPFGKPWVVLADWREASDIMTRRTREFDRSDFFRDMFSALVPLEQACLMSNDQWRFNRKLMADAMKPDFLDNVAAHEVYESTLHLIALWKEKARLAKGHAFDASEDPHICAADTIWAATFGYSLETSKSLASQLAKIQSIELPVDGLNEIAEMPALDWPEMYTAVKTIAQSCEIPMSSPLGRWHHWFAVKFYPSLRKAIKARNKTVNARIERAWKTYEDDQAIENEAKVKCVLDLIVKRETILARREGRKPDRHSRILFDELFGLIIAGFDSTAATVNWGLKYLTKHQDVQTRLRESLKRSHQQACNEHRLPSAEEIAKTDCPYLEAFMEEVLRHSGVISANMRVATVATAVLGHIIPKGINVFMLTIGPSMLLPAFPIDEDKRYTTAQESKGDTGRWAESKDKGDFDPSRWLTTDANGKESFDRRAAPLQTFGLGIRGCYGKRLAYLEMRQMYTLILWLFELLPLPPALEDFQARDIITHSPQNVRVRLAEVS